MVNEFIMIMFIVNILISNSINWMTLVISDLSHRPLICSDVYDLLTLLVSILTVIIIENEHSTYVS
jgi:hypothetical protein